MDSEKRIKYELVGPQLKKKLQTILKDIDDNLSLLYDVAVRDPKTGAYNFLFFRNMLEIEGAKAKRGVPLSLGILDVDFFKKINDKYGHISGDRVLVRLVEVITGNLRKSDIVARFGGEEFVVLMPNTTRERAFKVIDRLRKIISEDKQLEKYGVTVSCGVVQFLENDSLNRLKKRADEALYKAKENGRNRVEMG